MSLSPDASTPTLLSQVLDGHTLTLQLRLDPELVWFAGHFPDATPGNRGASGKWPANQTSSGSSRRCSVKV